MPGVTMRCLLCASASFIAATVVPGFTMTNSPIGCVTPGGSCALHVVPLAFARNAGTNTFHVPRASTNRNGFSRITGAEASVVYGGAGKLCVGALRVPTKTMFQLDPVQLPISLLRVSHCCWLPDFT